MVVVRLRVGSGLVPVSQRYRNAAGRCVDCTNGPHPRPVHTTALVHSKNVLKKLLSKSKKKTWYETPPPTPSLLNLPKKKDHEDSHRCKVLNTILFKAVSDLLTSAQLSYELQSFNPEITKVSLARDFSSCRVFWRTSRDAQRDELIQKTLERNAPHIRYLIMSQQIMGGVPPIVFLRDKQLAAIDQVDLLLQQADFGPDLPEDSSNRITVADEVGPSSHSSQPALYGIDHELLNKQIADWCQQSKKEEHSQPHELQQEQLLAIAEHKKQQIIKKRKRKAPPRDDDITPSDFLLAQQDVAMPQRWGQILKEEEPAFKEEEADLQELTSLEEKTTS
ncbi:putative ribosome-binding factor A, mitochondrial [Merluccius polli]|uniref:Ribosome-binding factor A, mitochondrial n=1 Tax=Merluccius polli TaxID=89951 RepID=A0AA47N4T8_MERPO|nr:putative ribosome-binding factor A, mitochondrial [Merluccius polli]